MDCPPSLGLVSVVVACQEVLVPVGARVMELQGLAGLLDTVDGVKTRLNNPQLRVTGVLACQVDQRTRLGMDVVQGLRRRSATSSSAPS